MTGTTTDVRPFEAAAPDYQAAGWPVIPIFPSKEQGAKGTPPRGVTGWEGIDLSAEQVEAHRQEHGDANIAIRAPVGVVGLDVDAYDGKPGGAQLRKWTKEFGPLPSTFVSTSRPDGVSGIRWYRVPSDWVGVGGVPGIELIQRHHRFALVWPSLHPKGRRYFWYQQDVGRTVGLPEHGIPFVTDLPHLPDTYLEGLRSTGKHYQGQEDILPADMDKLLTGGIPCHEMDKALLKYPEETEAGNSCHDTMIKVQMKLLRLGDQGHRGSEEALTTLYAGFERDRGDIRDTSNEWADALETGVRKVLASPTSEVHKGCCTEKMSPNGQAPDGFDLAGDSRRVSPDGRNRLDTSNAAKAADRIRHTIGKQELAGIFRRTDELVHTPQINEDGYVPAEDEDVDLGPAQVRNLTPNQLKALIEVRFDCGQWMEAKKGSGQVWVQKLLPRDSITSAYEAARINEDSPATRRLQGVTHTPALRPDGTVLDIPGYDTSTGMLFLPDQGLEVPPVPLDPSPRDMRQAVELFLTMTNEFPFVSDDHRANWCGLAFTPLMRSLLKPPYPMGVMTATNPGSGKGFLVGMIIALHGGVLHGEMPRDAEELRKTITSTLVDTTAPVVSFDNLTGVIRSSVLEGLLTATKWTDRYLGHTRKVTSPNDRLWMATGNNAMIGGDLARRVLYVDIDPKHPKPWTRTGFKIHPPTWVPKYRGQLLAAMLTIIKRWILDGMHTEINRSDDYAIWQGALTGMLHETGIPGTFASPESAVTTADPDQDDWKEFLEALYGAFPSDENLVSREFTVSEVVDALKRGGIGEGGTLAYEKGKPRIDPTKLPGDLADKFARASAGRTSGFAKSTGRWFMNRAGRYADGWKLENQGKTREGTMWRVIAPEEEDG